VTKLLQTLNFAILSNYLSSCIVSLNDAMYEEVYMNIMRKICTMKWI